MSISEILSIVMAGLAVIGFLDQRFRVQVEHERRFTALETKMEVFWKCIEHNAPAMLHSPHTPVIDRLLEKYQAGTIVTKERQTLKDLLEQGLKDGTYNGDRKALACILIATIEVRLSGGGGQGNSVTSAA